MRAVDTNILLRFVVGDDPIQFEVAARFLKARTVDDPAYVSLIVLAEMVWALDRRYGYPRESVRAVVLALLESAEVVFEEESSLSMLIADQVKGDIADHLVALCARRAGCMSVATFDKKAARSVPGMELLS
ncbi:MAG: type II toxin-antitoxin system VapC family toxin [Alphaproteobacteria bacterium]|nr:type II toxin-antitoxin system VapC family toxin [Alphaproteobacteria bacterium]